MNKNGTVFKYSGVEWLGDVPNHWEVLKIKHLAKILRGQFSHRPRNDPKLYNGKFPFIQTGDVANANKFIMEYRQTLNEDGYAVSKEFSAGTLVMTIAANIGDMAILNFNACFPDSVVGFIPSNKTGILFLYYLFSSMRKQFLSTAVLNTQLNLNIERISNLFTVIPPLSEQDKITEYLDRETTQIDNLIAAKEQMLTLLEEKREALISHAVTRGLDPNVTFKRSGLDWLGDIPQHWNIERAKNLFSVRDERSDSGDEELLSVSHITGVTSRADKQVYMFKAEDMTGYKRCTKGDFVTNTLWGWMGAMGVSPLDGIVSPDYHVYIFKGDLLPEFMELLCRSKPFIAEVVRWSKGVWSSRLRIYPENFFEIQLPVPPKSEQLELIDKVAKEDEKNKELKNALTDSIALLKERRSALITAAVTGQIALEEMTS